MELHRTEWIPAPSGQLIQVQINGIAAHEGAMRNAVLNLKYHGQRNVAKLLALVVVDAIHELGINTTQLIVTWAPTTPTRIRQRGFDQSELIARHVGAFMHRPVRRLLRREEGAAQTGNSRHQRLTSVRFKGRITTGMDILVIDDVVTTASTLRFAAYELVRCGAMRVTCIAPSRTM